MAAESTGIVEVGPWHVAPVPVFTLAVVVALAHLAVVAFEPGLWELVVFEFLVLLGLTFVLEVRLTAPASIRERVERVVVLALAFGLLVGGAAAALWLVSTVWQAATVVAAVCVTLSYALHRYQRFALGLAEEADEQ